MTKKWYAIYEVGEMSPSALFQDSVAAMKYAAGLKAKVVETTIDADMVDSRGKTTYLMTAFASFDPWKKG